MAQRRMGDRPERRRPESGKGFGPNRAREPEAMSKIEITMKVMRMLELDEMRWMKIRRWMKRKLSHDDDEDLGDDEEEMDADAAVRPEAQKAGGRARGADRPRRRLRAHDCRPLCRGPSLAPGHRAAVECGGKEAQGPHPAILPPRYV